jgi:hypothetical protein
MGEGRVVMRALGITDRLRQNTSPKRKRGTGDTLPLLARRASVARRARVAYAALRIPQSQIIASIVLALAWLLLTNGLRADQGAKGNGESAQAVLDGVAKMGRSEQQAWLGRLEERALSAAAQTFKGEEAAKEHARIRSLLHQKVVTWQALRELLDQTRTREAKPATPVAVDAKPPVVNHAKPRADVPRHETVNRPAVVKSDNSEKGKKGEKSEKGTKPVTGERVEVNVDELEARIAGSNMGFRTIESELDEKGAWDAARLEPLAERLKVLVIRRNDLSLFRDLVPADQRSSVGRLEEPRSAISELGARIFEARKAASGDEFKGTERERRAELERLDALSRRLADLEKK